MRQLLLVFILVFLSNITFAQKSQCVVKATIEGLGTQLIRFSYNEEPDGKPHYIHKLSHNNVVTFIAPVNELAFAQIITFKNKDHFRTKLMRFYLTPNDTVIISGKLIGATIDYVATGNIFSDQYSVLRKELLPLYEKESELYRLMNKSKDKIEKAKVNKEFNDLRFNIVAPARTEFAKKHLNFELVPQYFSESNVPKDTVLKYYSLLDSKVKDSFYGKRLGKLIEGWSITEEGDLVPQFSSNTLSGNNISISDFRGKYVVLDFWGSWCGWCIKGFPKMKEYYNKYNSKLEIIGISCNDTNSNWENAIKKYDLNWVHLFNEGTNDLARAFAIQSYPTKILIDRKGFIVKKFTGESQEFYDTIDKIMNQ